MFTAYLPLAKAAASITAGLGVSKIVTDIVKNNVAITTPIQAVTVKVGSFVLGSMLWEQSSKHIDRSVNDLLATVQKNKTEETPVTE